MLDSLAPYGNFIALVAAIIAAFGIWLGEIHRSNELRERDRQLSERDRELSERDQQLLKRADETATLQTQLLERADENARLQSELRESAQEALRQVTGQGSYAFVVGEYTRIEPALRKKEGIEVPNSIPIFFGVLNNSGYPAFSTSVSMMQRVPRGQGDYGGDSKVLIQGQVVGDVFPGKGMTQIPVRSELHKDRDNLFDIVLFTRSGAFGEQLIITWDGEEWADDYQLVQLPDEARRIERRVIHSVRPDFPYRDRKNAPKD